MSLSIVFRHEHARPDAAARPPAAAGVLLCVIYLLAVAALVAGAGRPFAYPLDDTYIHLDIGRTLATAWVWGTDPGAPAAASSSPLWSLLLAGAYILPGDAFGYVPLLLDVVFACGLIWLLLLFFRDQPAAGLCVAAVAFAVALPSLSMLGMEHVLHALLAVTLGMAACRAIAAPVADPGPGQQALIGLLAALSVAARYESLFLVAPLAALSLLRFRPRLAVALGLGAMVPLLGFGLLWIHNGGWLLPNSIILKSHLAEAPGTVPLVKSTYWHAVGNFRKTALGGGFAATLAGLLALLGWRVILHRRLWDGPVLFAACALAATAGHFAFAQVGWLYRYESWLIALDLTAIVLLAAGLLRPRAMPALALAIAMVFACRTYRATHETFEAMADRRLEHLAPAQFIDAFYRGQTVMVNDLGAATWFAPQTRVLDMFGLGNNEPVRLRLAPGGYDSAALREWAAATRTRIAVLEFCWDEVARRVPAEWPLVATWTIPRNVVFGDTLVAFFAVAPGEADALRQHLRAQPIPPGVMLRLDPPGGALAQGCL